MQTYTYIHTDRTCDMHTHTYIHTCIQDIHAERHTDRYTYIHT